MDERRKGNRSKSLLGARIVFNNRASTIDCTIRNISDQGARLVFGSPVAAPDEFDLVISQKEMRHRCRVAWRKADEMGVESSTRRRRARRPTPRERSRRSRTRRRR